MKTYTIEFTKEEMLGVIALMSIGATMLNDKYNYFDLMTDDDPAKIVYAQAMICVMDNIPAIKSVNVKFKKSSNGD